MPGVTATTPSTTELDDAVTALAWEPNGRYLWAGTSAGTVFRVGRDGQITRRSDRRRDRIVALAIDPESGTVASADATGLVALDGTDGEMALLALGSRARTVTWSGTGGRLALTSQAAGLLVTDRHARRLLALPPSRRHRLAAWHESRHSRRLAVVGAGATRWIGTDPIESSEIDTTVVPSIEVTVSVASAPGGWLAKGDLRGEITILNTEHGTALEIAGWPDPIERLAWLAGAGHLAVAGGDEVTAWATSGPSEADGDGALSGPERTTPDGSPILHLAPHPWRPEVAVATESGTATIWVPATGDRIEVGEFHRPISSVAWDALGERLAIGLRVGHLHVATPSDLSSIA